MFPTTETYFGSILDTYSDIFAWSFFMGLLSLCCTWCCLAQCIFQPFCTCRKRAHKMDRSLFYKNKEKPFRI